MSAIRYSPTVEAVRQYVQKLGYEVKAAEVKLECARAAFSAAESALWAAESVEDKAHLAAEAKAKKEVQP